MLRKLRNGELMKVLAKDRPRRGLVSDHDRDAIEEGRSSPSHAIDADQARALPDGQRQLVVRCEVGAGICAACDRRTGAGKKRTLRVGELLPNRDIEEKRI